ncbi:unnamed protein product [Paramecium sonneborni]|uniref:Uncharacterized protein n=1 Tax=Paramecium sonneborni TaxID=65129 RepID=A0A8S1RSE3_9CILI|nr:unnamed protein product [Paramecium sonneborni]
MGKLRIGQKQKQLKLFIVHQIMNQSEKNSNKRNNCINDSTPFKQWYAKKYNVELEQIKKKDASDEQTKKPKGLMKT